LFLNEEGKCFEKVSVLMNEWKGPDILDFFGRGSAILSGKGQGIGEEISVDTMKKRNCKSPYKSF